MYKIIKIRNAYFSDCKEIAKIHKECLHKSFLATLGERFLILLYKTLIEYKDGILIVAEDNGKIIEFFLIQRIQRFYKEKILI